MATPISSHVKDKNSIFTTRGEDMIFLVQGEILVFHQYPHNKTYYEILIIFQKVALKFNIKLILKN